MGRHLRWCIHSDSGSLGRGGDCHPFLTKKNEDAWGEFKGRIFLQSRFSWKKSSIAFCSLGDRG